MLRILLLLAIAPTAFGAHSWCGAVAPGKGLKLVRSAEQDRMCGFIQAKVDGPHKFVASVKGTRVWIGKQLVTGPVDLKADQLYSIHIEAPRNDDFELKWDWAGAALPIPPTVLYQPTETVGAPCAKA